MSANQDNILRPLPHAVGPEKALLSSMLQEPMEFIQRAFDEKLTADHFYMPAHSILFGVLSDLFATGQPIEFVSLTQKLLDTGRLDRVGGAAGITDIYGYDASSGACFSRHLEIVRDKFLLREMIRLSNETVAAAYDAPDEAQETLEGLERGVTAIAALASGCDHAPTTKESIRESFEEYERRLKGGDEAMGLRTFPALDHKIRGLHPGRMYVIGAYPEGGKSTICSEIVGGLVVGGVPCCYLPLEGTEKDLMTRIIIQVAGIPAQAYTDPRGWALENDGPELNKLTMGKIRKAITDLANAPLYIRRPAGNKLASVVSIIRRFHREYGIKVAVVDYAQRIKGVKAESREIEQTQCSNAIQELAAELGISIIVPSQLNEDGDTKHGKVWQEDGDAVLRIVQDRNKDSETYKQHRHIAIDKDRHNGSGGQQVPLILDRKFIRFVEGEDTTDAAKKKRPQFQR